MHANYEDDNSNYGRGDTTLLKLQNSWNIMYLKWLEDNHMRANTSNPSSASK